MVDFFTILVDLDQVLFSSLVDSVTLSLQVI